MCAIEPVICAREPWRVDPLPQQWASPVPVVICPAVEGLGHVGATRASQLLADRACTPNSLVGRRPKAPMDALIPDWVVDLARFVSG